MYGWRARLGIMIPSVNSVVESELAYLASLVPGVSCHFSRMIMRGETKVEQLESMSESIDTCVESLLDVSDIFLYACTSGSFLKGVTWDTTVTERIQDVACGKQAITTSNALVKALRELKAKTIALATPYINEVNERQINYFREVGIEVVAASGLSMAQRGGSGLCNPNEAYTLGRQVAQGQPIDALVLSCTNFRTLEVISVLESDLGAPVITSNQALFWAGIRNAGIGSSIHGFGQLLEI